MGLLSAVLQEQVVIIQGDGNSLRDVVIGGLIGLIGGFGIGVWRNRVLPMIAVLNFTLYSYRPDAVHIPEKLSHLSMQTWFMTPLPHGVAQLGEAFDALRLSSTFLEANQATATVLNTVIERLRSASSQDEVSSAILLGMSFQPLNLLLEAALVRYAVSVPTPELEAVRPLILPLIRRKTDFDGCIGIDFPTDLILFGSGLNENAAAEGRLFPVAQLVSQLDATRLLVVFEQMVPILERQSDLERLIYGMIKPIVDRETRWAAEVRVANYGSGPFLIEDRDLWISVYLPDQQIERVHCKLAVRTSEKPYSDVLGGHLVSAGAIDDIALIGSLSQSKLPNKEALMEAWSSGSGNAQVELRIRGRELPWSQRFRSLRVPFRSLEVQ